MGEKVYILMSGCVDDYHVTAVYSSEEKAEEEKEKLLNGKEYVGEVWVDEFELK